jgi:hypothetical protein
MIQRNCIPFNHPQAVEWEWLENINDGHDDGPFILYCEEWLEMMIFWILKPLDGEFP